MKRLSICLPALALALGLTLSGATPISKANIATPAPTRPTNHFQFTYYWFTYPGDAYIDHQTLAVEEIEWLVYYGLLVNTDPRGGTLVARGYLVPTWPHSTQPAAFLYSH